MQHIGFPPATRAYGYIWGLDIVLRDIEGIRPYAGGFHNPLLTGATSDGILSGVPELGMVVHASRHCN